MPPSVKVPPVIVIPLFTVCVPGTKVPELLNVINLPFVRSVPPLLFRLPSIVRVPPSVKVPPVIVIPPAIVCVPGVKVPPGAAKVSSCEFVVKVPPVLLFKLPQTTSGLERLKVPLASCVMLKTLRVPLLLML